MAALPLHTSRGQTHIRKETTRACKGVQGVGACSGKCHHPKTKPSYSPKSYVKYHVYVCALHYICDFGLGRSQYATRDYTQMEEQCRTEKDGQQMEDVQKLTIFQLLLQIHSIQAEVTKVNLVPG